MEEQSLNPILERRQQNQESIIKGFVGNFEDGNISTTGGHAYVDRSNAVMEEFRKSFGGKFELFKGEEDELGQEKVLLTHKAVEDSLVSDEAKFNRRKQIDQLADNLQKSNIDDLEKGEIMDKLVYGYGASNDTFKFVKTGKQIKAMLPACIEALAEQKGEIIATMNACVENAGIEPTEVYGGSNFKVIKIKRYPYDLIRQEYNEVSRAYAPYTDVQKACNQYNDLCYTLRNILEDILACKIILANVEDDKKYSLTISQLVALTLGDEIMNDDGIVIEKSNEDDLEKGGEGSKGGKVIGHTKSGKPIYENDSSVSVMNKKQHLQEKYKSFNRQDHKDAAEAHIKEHHKFMDSLDPKERKKIAYEGNKFVAGIHEKLASKKPIKETKSDDEMSKEYNSLSPKEKERHDWHMENKNDVSSGVTGEEVTEMHNAAMKHAVKLRKKS